MNEAKYMDTAWCFLINFGSIVTPEFPFSDPHAESGKAATYKKNYTENGYRMHYNDSGVSSP